jgi:spore coat polysaccharide biosynthesis predicted glycosyltransferase SpsG
MGETSHFDPAKLAFSVKELVESPKARERMAKRGRMLVDGRGTTRVVETAQLEVH